MDEVEGAMESTAQPAHGRVDYLRLSITDRCNLRCTYCMPADGVPLRSHDDILSYDEFAAVAAAAVAAGVTKVRVTGGEPLVRRGCADFIRMLAAMPGISDLSLTTNGLLLPRFAEQLSAAGLRRVNISIDSLERERFARITRGADVDEARAGIEAALAVGFDPVKINTVLLAGVEDEIDAFAQLTVDLPVHVRFIEYMPVDRRHGMRSDFVPASLVLERLRETHGLQLVDGPYGHGPARYWQVAGARGTIGFIAGVSDHFCESCNRLRLTADGRLRTCLFSGEEVNVRPLIGRPDELAAAIATAMSGKNYDRCVERLANERGMSEI